MRGALIVIVLISMLIAAILVIKNIGEQKSSTTKFSGNKIESIDRAVEVANDAQKKFDVIKQQVKEAN